MNRFGAPQADALDPSVVSWAQHHRQHFPPMVRVATLLTGSQAVAGDLVQDTYLRVMRRIDPTGPEATAYLRRGVVNACRSWHRRAWRNAGPLRPGADFADRDADTVDLDPALRAALARLSTRKRAVLILRFYLDMSEADTAAAVGCRVGTSNR